MRKRIIALVLLLTMCLSCGVVYADDTTTEATTESSSSSSGGSDGSWVRFKVNQLSGFFNQGCTGCTVINILQNSGLIDSDYKCPDGTWGGGQNNTDEFSTPFNKCKELVWISGTGCKNSSDILSGFYNKHSGDATWEMVTDQGKSETGTWCYVYNFNGKDLKDMSHEELVQTFQAFWNNDYWVIVGVNNKNAREEFNGPDGAYAGRHWMMLAGVTDDEIYFNDSAGGNIEKATGYYSGGGFYVGHVVLLKNDKISLKDAAGGKVAGTGNASNNNIGLTSSQFLGEDVDGIAAFCKLKETNLTDLIQDANVDNLNNNELVSLEDWQMMSEKDSDFIIWARRIIMIVGILITVWGILFYCAFWFDRINTYFDLDFVGILSFGKLRRSDTDEDCTFKLTDQPKSEARTINHKYCLIISVSAIAFGVLLISGVLFLLVRKIVNLVQRIF